MSQTRPPADRTLANLERTRQQIQELDQLLQQMLALPVSEDKSPARPAPSPAPTVPQPPAPASPVAPAEAAVFQPWTAHDPPAAADAPPSALPLASSTQPSDAPPTPWLCSQDAEPVQTAPVQTEAGWPSRSAAPGGLSPVVREWLLWLGLVLAVAVVGLSLGVWLGWNW